VPGTWAIASVSTVMWSPAVVDPDRPVRSMPERNSSVLSHHTPSGWNPKVYLLTELASGSGVALAGEGTVPIYVPRYGRCAW
jgi:hypothetical protein